MASISPVTFLLITSFWAGVHLILPIDTVPLITFSTGYYKLTDMIKAGIVPMISMIFVTALLIPIIVRALGY